MKILISVDSVESSKIILAEAAPFVKGFPDAEIHIFTVLDLAAVSVGHATVDKVLMDSFTHQGEEIQALARESFGGKAVTFSSEYGSPVDTILHKIDSLGCDLHIMGTHGRKGFDHLLMGSVASKVLRLSQCNTLVIPMRKKE